MPDANRISVVIRTFNSGKTLDQVLSGMAQEEGDEFIVVDSGSTDATLRIAEKHGAKIVIAQGPFHYSKSLNLGFQAAKNPWVLVISSHCIPVVPGFLGVFRREIAQFPQDVVAGYAPSTLSGKSDPGLDAEKISWLSKSDYKQASQVCGNGNTIYRRSAWEELPFDEEIRTAEDKLWIQEMLERGYRFAYIPTARGINRSQAPLRYMYIKGYRDARAAVRPPAYKPMSLYQFAGALKNLAKKKALGEIDLGNWARYTAHTFGQFFGSRGDQDNTAKGGGS